MGTKQKYINKSQWATKSTSVAIAMAEQQVEKKDEAPQK